MAIAQSINNTLSGYYVDLVNNILRMDITFTDATDGTIVGFQVVTAPLNGTDPVTDKKGRVLVGAAPANILTPEGTLTTNIQTAIANAVAANKLKL